MIRRAVLGGVTALACALLPGTVAPLASPAAAKGTPDSGVPRCQPSALSATLAVTGVGSASTSLAGAVSFRNTSSKTCALRGVPQVEMVATGGRTLDLFEEAVGGSGAGAVALAPGRGGGKPTLAASSLTWSDLTCGVGSFSLLVRFTGWATPLRVPYGSTVGFTGTPCAPSGRQTVYVGPVAAAGA